MEKEAFFKLVERMTSGYKGSFFMAYDMIENSEVLKKIKALDLDDAIELLKLIYKYNSKGPETKFENYSNKILNNVTITDINKYGFDPKEVASRNAKYIYQKDIHYLLPYLFFDNDKFNERIHFNNVDVIDKSIDKGEGGILCLFHWGLFQVFVPLILKKKIKVNFIINYYACLYERELMSTFLNEYSDCVDYIATGDPGIYRKVNQKLKMGEYILLLPELSLGLSKPKVRYNFLGNNVMVPEGAAIMSLLFNSEIIPCTITEKNNTDYYVNFFNPLKIENGTLDDVSRLSTDIFKLIEEEVIKNPYMWCGWEIYHRMIAND